MTRNKTVVTVISKVAERPAAKDACLVVIYGLELGKKFSLETPSIIIGRSSKADIQIDQESVSRNHAKIINTGKQILIRDLGSTNGTYVNDELIDEHVLQDRDFIKIGRTIFKFLTGGNVEAAYHEEIYRLTTDDGLTQIKNRRFLTEALESELRRAQRYQRDLSLIMFDIDHFKRINDTYGHLAGDHVLKHLAGVIKQRIRREDLFARFGGEEFSILLPEICHDNAMIFAEKIRALVERTEFKFEDAMIEVHISVGVASLEKGHLSKASGGGPAPSTPPSEDGAIDVSGFMKIADEKLYVAKNSGRNRVVG